jgi:hypothetical protein
MIEIKRDNEEEKKDIKVEEIEMTEYYFILLSKKIAEILQLIKKNI